MRLRRAGELLHPATALVGLQASAAGIGTVEVPAGGVAHARVVELGVVIAAAAALTLVEASSATMTRTAVADAFTVHGCLGIAPHVRALAHADWIVLLHVTLAKKTGEERVSKRGWGWFWGDQQRGEKRGEGRKGHSRRYHR